MKPIVNKITDKWVNEMHPCLKSVKWWTDKKRISNPLKILTLLIKEKHYDWANWFIVRIMTYHDYVSYAVFAAEQFIHIYEKRFPNDKRPREAIEAAKRCIKNPSQKNKGAAYVAAYAAACAAADASDVAADAVYAAADAAADAAYAAADIAYAIYAVYAAGAAHAAEDAAYADKEQVQLKILRYGMKLLES